MMSLPLPRTLIWKSASSREESCAIPFAFAPLPLKSGRGVRKPALILAAICALALATAAAKQKPPVQYQIPTPPLPDFSALDWLMGDWAGKTLPNSPPGELRLSVNYDLEKHFVVFHGETSLAATPTVPASNESWIGILSASPDRKGFILQIFSSHGFMTRFRLTMEEAEVHLNPEGGDSPPPGWLFRRVWARTGPDEFSETVQAAPPGKPFFDYYSVKFTRVVSPSKPAPEPVKSAPETPKNSPH
jgi:hypothetical protein